MDSPRTGGEAASGTEGSGLAALFEQMRPELLRFLSARCGEAALAQDLLQDLWLRTVNRVTGPIDNARAYLFRAANNLVLDHRRGEQRAMARDRVWIEQNGNRADGDQAVDPALRADQALEQEQEVAMVRKAVDGLPTGARTALRLYRFEGLSQPEVAARMGISRSGVEKHLALAMRQLRQALAGLPDGGRSEQAHHAGPRMNGLQQDNRNDRG